MLPSPRRFAAAIAFLALASAPALAQTGTLSGRGMDAESGETIANAVVLVDDRPVYTLSDARVGLFPELASLSRSASRERRSLGGALLDADVGQAWAEVAL